MASPIDKTHFQGDYMWLSSDGADTHARRAPSNTDSKVDIEVRQHIQKYRKWKREERTKALSVKLPTTNLVRNATGLTPTQARPHEYPAKDIEDDGKSGQERYIVSPTSILKRGQSDPFNALAVEVTPEVNQIVSFFREFLILSFYNTKWETSKAAIVSMHWQSIVQALHDRGSALGFLGRNAQILTIVSQNRRIKYAALRYTSDSVAILRTRLEQSPNLSGTDQWHVSMLWGTEILFRNLDAALLHGRMLRRMAEDQAEKGTLDLIALRYILYYDIHLCTMLMVRSVFDYFKWVPEQYRKLAPLATSLMNCPVNGEDDAAIGLDPCIPEDILLPIFKERRRHMREYSWWLERSFEEMSLHLNGWLAVCQHICHGQLITYALDCVDDAVASPNEEKGRLFVQAYLSLAALYVTRGIGGQLIVCGIDIFEARPSILDKLCMALRSAEDFLTDDDSLRYKNAKLWALYVAARGAKTLQEKPDKYESFAHEFGKLREDMGLSTWTDTQEILKGFLHYESIHPIDDETPPEVA